jgi:hypothetical protein
MPASKLTRVVRGRWLAAAVLAVGAVGAVVLAGAGAAHAADGTGLTPGGVACTDKIRSDTGIWAYGHASYRAAVTWTVQASSTVDGPEAVLVRRTAWELTTVNVTAPTAGPAYYRVCLTNTAGRTVDYQFARGANPGGNALNGLGPHTATLGPGGRACGEWVAGWLAPAVRLVGASTLQVTYSVRAADGDGNILREEPLRTATAIDQPLSPAADESNEICVTNVSTGTASVSWDVLRV